MPNQPPAVKADSLLLSTENGLNTQGLGTPALDQYFSPNKQINRRSAITGMFAAVFGATLSLPQQSTPTTSVDPLSGAAFSPDSGAFVISHKASIAIKYAKEMMETIKQERIRRGHRIDDYDTRGLIGPEISSVVSLEGNLHSKLFATLPEWAGAIVKVFHESGLKPGDLVAVGMTGSLPGLNINLLAAMKAYGLKPIIISSACSSGFGATNEDFMWPVMEGILYRSGLIDERSVYCSVGGPNDAGWSRKDGYIIDVNHVKQVIKSEGINLIDETYLSDATEFRMKYLYKASDYDSVRIPHGPEIPVAHINIGGGRSSRDVMNRLDFENRYYRSEKDRFILLNFRHASDLFDDDKSNDERFSPTITEPYFSLLSDKLNEIRQKDVIKLALAGH